MYNFLLSEKYRTTRQPSLYFFFLICIGILIATAFLMRLVPPEEQLTDYGMVIAGVLSFGIYIFAAVITTSFSKERPMILQLTTQGHPRWRIFLGQYVLSLGVALVFALLLLLLAGIIGLLMFDHDAQARTAFLKLLLQNTTMAFLLLIPLHAMALSLQYLMRNIAMSVAVFFVVSFFLPAAFTLGLGLHRILDWFVSLTPYYQSMEVLLMEIQPLPLAKLFWAVVLNTGFWLGIGLIKFTKSEL